ncbi:hypothetical protein [Flavobacterium sp. N2820]|uniref:hypothetical protein n=1 Tax=Flavobacterium sp. N2820 TaxID=2986834 RepID=UPI0022251565|nr:hypothetical protein [Flavobacterium sp. N2820]
MKKLIPILLITLSIGLQSCNSTVKSVYRDDFRSASKAEIEKIHKEVNAKNSNKSILFLTQIYKGEKIIISQNGKTIYSEYPITNLNNRIATYLSFNNQQDLLLKDNNSKKEILIPSKQSSKHKYIYVMKKVNKGKFQFIITYSNTLRPI